MAPSAVAFVAYQMLGGETVNPAITYALMGYARFIAAALLFIMGVAARVSLRTGVIGPTRSASHPCPKG